MFKLFVFSFIYLFLLTFSSCSSENQTTEQTQQEIEETKEEVKIEEIDFDQLSNEKIFALECTEESFLERQKFNTATTDENRTSLKNKVIAFNSDFANSELYLYQNTARAVVKTFRDFPCLDKIKIITTRTNELPASSCSITKKQASEFFVLDFEELRKDIKIFRSEFLESERFDKEFYQKFGNKFVKKQ